jgi:hypothetical protein
MLIKNEHNYTQLLFMSKLQRALDSLWAKANPKQAPQLDLDQLCTLFKELFSEIGSKRYISRQMVTRILQEQALLSRNLF